MRLLQRLLLPLSHLPMLLLLLLLLRTHPATMLLLATAPPAANPEAPTPNNRPPTSSPAKKNTNGQAQSTLYNSTNSLHYGRHAMGTLADTGEAENYLPPAWGTPGTTGLALFSDRHLQEELSTLVHAVFKLRWCQHTSATLQTSNDLLT